MGGGRSWEGLGVPHLTLSTCQTVKWKDAAGTCPSTFGVLVNCAAVGFADWGVASSDGDG